MAAKVVDLRGKAAATAIYDYGDFYYLDWIPTPEILGFLVTADSIEDVREEYPSLSAEQSVHPPGRQLIFWAGSRGSVDTRLAAFPKWPRSCRSGPSELLGG